MPASTDLAILADSPTREQMEARGRLIAAVEAAGDGVKLEHRDYFAPGVYVRELFIPKGTELQGARHKTDHVVMFDGDISVWHEGDMVRLIGRHTLVSIAGAQRIGRAHEDTWCTGVFPNPDNETDVRVLEARFIEDSDQLQCNRMPVLPRREEMPCLV
jgi:hypothetical protein